MALLEVRVVLQVVGLLELAVGLGFDVGLVLKYR